MVQRVRHQLFLPKPVSDRLEALAAAPGATKSAILADAVTAWLNRRGTSELEDRFARVVQVQRPLDAQEDAFAVVHHPGLREQRIAAKPHVHLSCAGMVHRVVDHLRQAIAPDVAHVLGQVGQMGRSQLLPDAVFRQADARKGLMRLDLGLELVAHAGSTALAQQQAGFDRLVQPGAGCLAAHAQDASEADGQVAGVFLGKAQQSGGIGIHPGMVKPKSNNCKARCREW